MDFVVAVAGDDLGYQLRIGVDARVVDSNAVSDEYVERRRPPRRPFGVSLYRSMARIRREIIVMLHRRNRIAELIQHEAARVPGPVLIVELRALPGQCRYRGAGRYLRVRDIAI